MPVVVVELVDGLHPTAVKVLMNTGTMGSCMSVSIKEVRPRKRHNLCQQRQQRGGVTSSYPGGV